MNQIVARLRKSPRRIAGALICGVGVVLLLVSFAGALGSRLPATATPPKVQSVSASSPSQAAGEPPPKSTATAPQPTTQKSRTNPQTQTANTQTTPNTETATTPEPATITVSLSINSMYKGEVSIGSDKNHCDVLNQALADGTIQSLDLHWNTTWKTYGVYKINGIGEDNTVNWVYEVNGKSPPVGCSLAKPKAGDEINWKYLK